MAIRALFACGFSALVFSGALAHAEEIRGTPGSPSATRTIDGTQLPAPPAPFGGTIERGEGSPSYLDTTWVPTRILAAS